MSDSETQPLLHDVRRGRLLESIEHGGYRVYKSRWFILAVVALLNVSNGMIWITFSPISDLTADFYKIDDMKVNWLSLVFMITSIPLGITASYLLDTFGLRTGIILASWLNVIGSALRVVSAVGILPHNWMYPILLTGQTLAACAQPFMMFAPTKVAALWFPNNQRATANMIASISNPVGILLANVLSPVIVTKTEHLPLMMEVYAIPAGIAVLMATCGVCSSVPPSPPTASAAEESMPFCQGLKKLACNKSYWILAVSFGTGLGLFSTLSTLLEQILAPKGYSDTFAGMCGALLFGIGVVGSGFASVYVDKTKKFEEVAKISYAASAAFSIGFCVLTNYYNKEVFLALAISCVGFFGFPLYPLCLELCVECTYPVAEATSSGFLIISGQIQAIALVVVMQLVATPYGVDPGQQEEYDFSVAKIIYFAAGAVVSVVFVIFFKCDYKRLQAEQQIAAEQILNYSINRRTPLSHSETA